MADQGLDRTEDFQRFCGSRLDRIQIDRITGLGLKNFTVRSSLLATIRLENVSVVDEIS